jgi:FAD/FMN-containing dehydrogenase
MAAAALADELGRAQFDGRVVDRTHPDYERLRRVYNAVIDRHPAAIVQAGTPADVQRVVGIARNAEAPLAVRCGGHSFAGLGTCDDGLVCDVSPLRDVVVDPTARTIDVGGGALLRDVDAAGAPFGLITPSGVVSHTGVGGLTLGGGMGYLSRRFGLTIDSLLEADIVTADGRIARIDADAHSDLFWAIRGGGGNFGIVTRFRFRMHELGPVLIRRWTHSAPFGDTLRRYRDAIAGAPRQLTSAFIATRDELALRAIWTGPMAGSTAAIRPLELPGGAPASAEATFLELQRTSDEVLSWGRRYYSKGGFLAELDDRAVDVITEAVASVPMRDIEVYCLQLGGAVQDITEAATAYSGRSAGFYWIAQGVWDSPADDARAIAWCRETARRLGELSLQANYVNEQADTGIARSAYGARTYDRLAELKWRYDPTNLFRLNQNIEPAPPGGNAPS